MHTYIHTYTHTSFYGVTRERRHCLIKCIRAIAHAKHKCVINKWGQLQTYLTKTKNAKREREREKTDIKKTEMKIPSDTCKNKQSNIK